MKEILKLDHIQKYYGNGGNVTKAIQDISFSVQEGEFVGIMGASGSGKSTMMHVLAGLDSVTSGTVAIEGIEITGLNDNDLTRVRRDRIGFVFQSFNLVPTLDAKANILLPLRLAGRPIDRDWFNQVTSALGLTDRLTHRPSELSGGQQQRVAIARALVMRPAVIVADEPTGNLDSTSSAEVLGLLRDAVDRLQQTVIMVTHDEKVSSLVDRVLVMEDGHIVRDSLTAPMATAGGAR